jgi:hypothetical protein
MASPILLLLGCRRFFNGGTADPVLTSRPPLRIDRGEINEVLK